MVEFNLKVQLLWKSGWKHETLRRGPNLGPNAEEVGASGGGLRDYATGLVNNQGLLDLWVLAGWAIDWFRPNSGIV